MEVSILLADDHKILRDGLHVLLEQQSRFHVVGEASDGLMTVQMARELSPDVVVMDVGMPQLNGIEATRQIQTEAPGCRIIGLSMHNNLRFVLRMFRAGALGYILKHSAYEELAMAIAAVMHDHRFVSPEIADLVLGEFLNNVDDQSSEVYTQLTPREREVLQLLSEGCSTKEISSMLLLSVNTVESYRRNIMDKLNLHNIAQLTRFAIREGLTPVDVR